MAPDQPREQASSSPPEPAACSFVIRIWVEETAREARRAKWRGHITRLPNGERRYIEHLDEIAAIIALSLEEMGVRFYGFERLQAWIGQWRRLNRRGR